MIQRINIEKALNTTSILFSLYLIIILLIYIAFLREPPPKKSKE